jgi:hypothetical protein
MRDFEKIQMPAAGSADALTGCCDYSNRRLESISQDG